jgi:hypothetical protein
MQDICPEPLIEERCSTNIPVISLGISRALETEFEPDDVMRAFSVEFLLFGL